MHLMTQPALINLLSSEYSQEFHLYPFAIKLDTCVRSCNTLNDLSNKVCVPNKTKDSNLRVFNMAARINNSKALTKDVSCKCRCKFDGKNIIQTNGGITINVDIKSIMYVNKIMFEILLHGAVKRENILQVLCMV